MAAENLTAGVVTPPLTVNQFIADTPSTAGNVGVCLSGGGSRALTAGMGQLQALAFLTANGVPLLGQVKALSTVSGGSWLGVPFAFLRASGPSDADYLGIYNSDQGALTPAQLAQLPQGNAGVPITSDLFLPELFAIEAFLLYEFMKVPPSMLWQTVIALNILRTYNLFSPGAQFAPADLFSYDQQSLQRSVTGPNPVLSSETADLFADAVASDRTRRPYLICNMAMFLSETGTALDWLAPVQATPFFTGIIGTPGGFDANRLSPGGGGITSFGFNSIYVSQADGSATVAQQRQWSLTDIVGTSSAFFAQKLQEFIAYWEDHPLDFAATLLKHADKIVEWIERHFDAAAQAPAKAFVRKHSLATTVEDLAILKFSLPNLESIIPAYQYWPVAEPTAVSKPTATMFADGGSLENTGINGMLVYSDIHSLIAFVNTEQPMVLGEYGISDGASGFQADTNIVVDESIPPLFGYQPYEPSGNNRRNQGYVLYDGASGTDYPMYAHNKVFDPSQFPAFLRGLWAASGSGSNGSPAVFAQQLDVLPNSWFGVIGGNTVTVVWCYLNLVTAWQDLFANKVAALIATAVSQQKFPHYDTFNTRLTATEINLLANLTGWCVVTADQNSKVFSNLFAPSSARSAPVSR